jgi:hypothetical protein
MIATAFIFIVIIQALVLSGLSFIFNRIIKSPGLQKLNRFTVILLSVCIVVFFLPLLKIHLIDLHDLLPARLITMVNKPLALAITICLSLFFIISILKLRKGGNLHVLIAVWIVLAAVNIFELIAQVLVVYSYTTVVGEINESYFDQITVRDGFYFLLLIKPFISPLFWLIISCISLSKIRKEKRKEALPALS